jgi:hypothetical protein
MPYWEYLHWVVYVGAGVGMWRYLPLTVIRLTAAFTRDEQRHIHCMEVLLARKDPSVLPSYLAMSKNPSASKPAVGQVNDDETQSVAVSSSNHPRTTAHHGER